MQPRETGECIPTLADETVELFHQVEGVGMIGRVNIVLLCEDLELDGVDLLRRHGEGDGPADPEMVVASHDEPQLQRAEGDQRRPRREELVRRLHHGAVPSVQLPGAEDDHDLREHGGEVPRPLGDGAGVDGVQRAQPPQDVEQHVVWQIDQPVDFQQLHACVRSETLDE